MKYMTSKEFYSALESNEYGRQYLELIEKVQSEHRSPKKGGDGYERHHVQPVALSGSNEETNLIKLTTFEHCLAHILLYKAIPLSETAGPLTRMWRQYDLSSLEEQNILEVAYSWSKEREKALHRPKPHSGTYSKGFIGINNGTIEKRVSPEKLQSYLNKGFVVGGLPKREQGLVHIFMGDRRKKVAKEDLSKYLEEGWQKGRGNVSWNLGRTWSDEVKKKMSEAAKGRVISEKQRKDQSERMSGRISIYRGDIYTIFEQKLVRPEELGRYLENGWAKGRFVKSTLQRLRLKHKHQLELYEECNQEEGVELRYLTKCMNIFPKSFPMIFKRIHMLLDSKEFLDRFQLEDSEFNNIIRNTKIANSDLDIDYQMLKSGLELVGNSWRQGQETIYSEIV